MVGPKFLPSFSDPEALTTTTNNISCPYTRLPDGNHPAGDSENSLRPIKRTLVILLGVLLVFLVVVALIGHNGESNHDYVLRKSPETLVPLSRGVSDGVSEKSQRRFNGVNMPSFSWTITMLSWQRTGFHFQPEKNWMSDPNGPMFYKGWYHFFYQHNPNAAFWGDIIWGHAVSKNLINWYHLPPAMVPDQWYDINGVWTGSATLLPDGQIMMLYTSAIDSVQVQNLAYPANLSDPLLLNWIKYSGNPILLTPPGIGIRDFRDPTTAWLTPDGKWRIGIGSKVDRTGITLVYDTEDFKKFDQVDGVLHAVHGTGMWECVDFYPVSKLVENGLDTSVYVNGPQVKHVLKASMDDTRNDFYALGTYHHNTTTWTPDNPEIDIGYGLMYDYGNFYASKTFYDPKKHRRILWGLIIEYDSLSADVMKGWASLQGIPRTVLYDTKTGSNLIQWPVEELESLRTDLKEFKNVKVERGSVVPLDVGQADQLDIVAEFKIDDSAALQSIKSDPSDRKYSCSGSAGAAQRGALGPFGFLVLADESLSERTPVYFYIAKGSDGNLETFFCSDLSRSSKANDVNKNIYGSVVPVLKGEKLAMRILVDHSIVESFAQGGRTCVTSRVYPTKAINGATRVFLFNNASSASITTSFKIWHMKSAPIEPYPFELYTNHVYDNLRQT